MAYKNLNLIYLEEYGTSFRNGYDAALIISAIKESIELLYEEKKRKEHYIKIHKDSISVCHGLCSENLFYFEIKEPSKNANIKLIDEVWIYLKPLSALK